jgi:hypothetical protein
MNKDVKAILEAVTDRSAAQKEMRIEKLRAELSDFGLSVVSTEWLNAVISEHPLAGAKVRA